MVWGKDRGIDLHLVRLHIDKRGSCQLSPLRLEVPQGQDRNKLAEKIMVNVAQNYVGNTVERSDLYSYMYKVVGQFKCKINKDCQQRNRSIASRIVVYSLIYNLCL